MEKRYKGQVGNLQGIVATLIVVSILLVAGFMILQRFSQEDKFFEIGVVSNETGAYANGTVAPSYIVDRESGERTFDFELTHIWIENETKGTGYNFTNATLLTFFAIDNNGVLQNTSVVNATRFSNMSISYTVTQGDDGWLGVNDTIEAVNSIPDLLGLIILIAIVGIVLAVVFNVIPGGRAGGA